MHHYEKQESPGITDNLRYTCASVPLFLYEYCSLTGIHNFVYCQAYITEVTRLLVVQYSLVRIICSVFQFAIQQFSVGDINPTQGHGRPRGSIEKLIISYNV